MIKNVKLSNNKGQDGISFDLLKLMGNAISKSITLIINQSLRTGIFPDKLKIAKVILIFKKDSKKLIKNYRPISVLPVISKIFEMAIHEQLSDYFTTNSLFCRQQYGFMKNASTEQGWGQVQLTKYSSTPSTPNVYQVQVLVKYSFFKKVLKYIKYFHIKYKYSHKICSKVMVDIQSTVNFG